MPADGVRVGGGGGGCVRVSAEETRPGCNEQMGGDPRGALEGSSEIVVLGGILGGGRCRPVDSMGGGGGAWSHLVDE
jgi:hypothetical protein